VKDWPLADTSGLALEDERWLSMTATLTNIDAWRLWWFYVHRDASALTKTELHVLGKLILDDRRSRDAK
jgi:hypothetical protein